MDFDEIRELLLWCTVINFGLLLLWFGIIAGAGDWIHRLHGKWFPVSRETFYAIHYGGALGYKLAVFFFNVVPLLVMLAVG